MLLDDDGNIFLCDFGQAVRLKPTKDQVQQIPQPNSPKRNPKYMAPEQDNYHCCASDQYALGLVTCELLCGEFPDTIPPSVTDWKAQGFRSLGIAHTLETALSPKPQDRHENIQAFADALKKEIDKEIRKGTTKSTSLVINEPQPPALSP